MKDVNNYFLVILLLLLFTAGKSVAQNEPTIIPPSPTAQAFMQYGEIPVSYSTGVPDIEIPIYTLEGKKLKLPITISYHASGIKVDDVSSAVGLGWVLNCGGLIARTVFGIPDEEWSASRVYDSASQLLDSVASIAWDFDSESDRYIGIDNLDAYFNSTFKGQDPMSDRFFYKLPDGVSGVFRYNYDENLSYKNVITLPYRPLIIKKTVNDTAYGLNCKIESFTITDENGIVYKFKSFLTGTPKSYSEWYLTKMISADGSDSIVLNYSQQGVNQVATHVSQTYDVHTDDKGDECTPDGVPYYHLFNGYSPLIFFNEPILTSVESSKAIVNFTYNYDRQDFNKLPRLSEITISPVNSPGTIIKKIQFNQSYFGTSADNNERLRLDSVTISAPGALQSHNYSFTYYENIVLPPYPFNMAVPEYSEDFWGYYNGSNSSSLVPSDFIANSNYKQMFGGDRDPNTTYSKACMLTGIKYPTGGSTVFNFERNYADGVYPYKTNPDGYVGGYRIGSITNYNAKGKVVGVKTYVYSGAHARPINQELFSYVQDSCRFNTYMDSQGIYYDCWIQASDTMVFSSPILPLEVAPGLPIAYTTVTVYNGTLTNNTGKTVYCYNPPYLPDDYTIDTNPYDAPRYIHPFQFDEGNYVPELIFKEKYSFDGTHYHPVTMEENTYSNLFYKKFHTGIKLTRTKYFPEEVASGYPGGTFVDDFINSIGAVDAEAYQEASLITNSKKYTFDPKDSTKYVLTSTNYTYDQKNLGIKEKSTYTSAGNLLKTTFNYPCDDEYDLPPYPDMRAENIISPVVEQFDSINATPLNSVRTNYSYWGNDSVSSFITPVALDIEYGAQSTSSQTFTIASSSRVTISLSLEMCAGHYMLTISGPTDYSNMYYPTNNPVSDGNGSCTNYSTQNIENNVTLSPGSYTVTFSYLTDPNYPDAGFYGTASLSATSPSSVFHTTSTATDRIYPASVDVKKGNNPYETRLIYQNYDKYGNIASVSKAHDIDVSYIWGYNGNYPVVRAKGIDESTLQTIVTEALPSGFSTLDDLLNSITSFPDTNWNTFNKNLRSITSSLITTYTYKPTIGITSKTDPSGMTTYYNYDAFGRLYQILDSNKKVLKQYEYHYGNQ